MATLAVPESADITFPPENMLLRAESLPWSVYNKATLAIHQFEYSKNLTHLDFAIVSLRALQNNTPAISPQDTEIDSEFNSPPRHLLLGAVGKALLHLFAEDTCPDHIDAAIEAFREATSLVSHTNTAGLVALNTDLAEALCVKFENRGGHSLLVEAIELCRQTVCIALEQDNSVYSTAVFQLSRVLLLSYTAVTRNYSELDEILELCRQGLQYYADYCGNLPRILARLGTILMLKYQVCGVRDLLDEAESIFLFVLNLHPVSHARHHISLFHLSGTYWGKYTATGNIHDSAKAIHLLEQASSLCSPMHSLYIKLNDTLSGYSVTSWRQTNKQAELDRAYACAQAAVSACHDGHPHHWNCLTTLSAALYYRTAAMTPSEQIAALSEILVVCRKALQQCEPGHSHYIISAMNIAVMLNRQYILTGNIQLLEDGIEIFQGCMESGTGHHRNAMKNLAQLLEERFRRLGNMADVEKAISIYHSWLEQLGDQDVNVYERWHGLAKLGSVYLMHYWQSSLPSNLDKAIYYAEKANAMGKQYQPNRCLVPALLGEVYSTRYTRTSAAEDLDAARKAFNDALSVCESGQKGVFRICLASLALHGAHTSVAAVLDNIYDAISQEELTLTETFAKCLPLLSQIRALGSEHFQSAPSEAARVLDIYAAVNSLLPDTVYMNMDIHSRLQNLSLQEHVATHALAYGGLCSQLGKALEIFEHSQSLFWSQALSLRTPMDGLPADIQESMGAIMQELDRSSLSYSPRPLSTLVSSDLGSQGMGQQHREHVSKLRSLVEHTRSLPGFSHFMLPDNISTLSNAAKDGPIIILSCGSLSCNAVVLLHSTTIQSVALPLVTQKWVMELCEIWDSAVEHGRNEALKRLNLIKKRRGKSEPYQKQGHVLRELWQNIVLPIILNLDLKKSTGRNRTRIWWCCSGEFAFLPMHAAGDGNEWCSDYVVSSYIPHISSLLNARRGFVKPTRAQVKAVLGAMFEQSLPMTKTEIQNICAIIPSSARVPLPPQEDALHPDFGGGITTDTVMQHISNVHILHLACHGTQDAEDPLNSGFILKNQKLTVARLMHAPLPLAFFAFMSACETAKGDAKFANQNIHLGAAMLFAGFKSVIGTMWTMNDVDGPNVAKIVYERLFEGDSEYLDPDSIPYALDEATGILRKQGHAPGRWATYIHMGI